MPMPHRRYHEYSRPFRVLLAVADLVTWVYFFGIPFSDRLRHLSDLGRVIQFVVHGVQQALK